MRRLPLALTLAALALLAALCCRPEPRPTVAIWPRSPGFGIAGIADDEEARVRLFRGPERDRLTLDGRELPVSGRVGHVVKWRPEDHPPGLAPRLAWTEELGSRQRWWVDGRSWPWGSGCGALRFDADGHAWTAQHSGQVACVLRDGQEVARFDSILADEGGRLNAGVDGRRGPTLPAFVGRDRQGTWLLMPDGRYGPFERVAGIAYDRALVVAGEFSFESGAAAAERLLALDAPPTAIFAANDDTAAGIMRVASGRGLRIPRDVSVFGFDDLPMARQLWPALTTVRQPSRAMGRIAAEQLLRAIRGEAARMVEVPYELRLRDSTGPVPTHPRRR